MPLDQRNEIAVELTKGLEVGGYEFSKYIPEYLGELALLLHPKELDELIDGLRSLLGSTDDRIVSVALHTVGVLLECCPVYPRRFLEADGAFERRRRGCSECCSTGWPITARRSGRRRFRSSAK